MVYNAQVLEKLKALGAADVGFTVTQGLSETYASVLPYAVSLSVKLSDFVIDEIDGKPTFAYFQHYRTANAFLDRLLFELGLYIESEGYAYLPIAASQSIPDGKGGLSGIVSHKAAARQAGLGSIGKNDIFISKQYGPRIRLGTLLTDMPFDTVTEASNPDVCGSCTVCVNACPAMAICGRVWQPGMPRAAIIDAAACSAYMKAHFQHIGRGAVCGICMRLCPKGIQRRERHEG